MTTKRRSDADYDEMAKEFEAGPITPTGPIEDGPGAYVTLKGGRPVGRKVPAGNTPITSLRLAPEIRKRVDDQAARESVAAGELIRRAVVEYLDRREVEA